MGGDAHLAYMTTTAYWVWALVLALAPAYWVWALVLALATAVDLISYATAAIPLAFKLLSVTGVMQIVR